MPEHLHLAPELAAKAEELFLELGLDLNTAIHLFLRQSLRENALPFALRLTAASAPAPRAEAHPKAGHEDPAAEPDLPSPVEKDAEELASEEISEDGLEGQSFVPEGLASETSPGPVPAQPVSADEQLSGLRQAFFDMGLLGTPLHRVRTLNQLYAIGEANTHVQGWREAYVSGDEPFALDFGSMRVELGYRDGGSIRVMDGRLPDEVLEADAVFPRDLSAVFSAVVGQRLTDVRTVRVRHEHGEREQLHLHFADERTLIFSPEREWAALWLCDQHGSVMFAPEAVWRRSLGERAWLALR